jgi:hypothetical protein
MSYIFNDQQLISASDLGNKIREIENAEIPELQWFRRQVRHHITVLEQNPGNILNIQNATRRYYEICQSYLQQYQMNYQDYMDHIVTNLRRFARIILPYKTSVRATIRRIENVCTRSINEYLERMSLMKRLSEVQFYCEERFNAGTRGDENVRRALLDIIDYIKRRKQDYLPQKQAQKEDIIRLYNHLSLIYQDFV